MDNLKEFKELANRYNSITIDEIEQAQTRSVFKGLDIAVKITGMGSRKNCTLCAPINIECHRCTWVTMSGSDCISFGINSKTYEDIVYSKNPTELIEAFKNRAKLMQKILDSNG